MADTKWSGYLNYTAWDVEMDKLIIKNLVELHSPGAPVAYFSVKGGVNRIIDLSSTEDISLTSEFEQARSFKNLTVHMPPNHGFSASDLMQIALKKLPLSIIFQVGGRVGRTLTQSLSLKCKDAKISTQPTKSEDEKGNVFMVVKMDIPNAQLIHGFMRKNELVEEEM